MFCASSLLKNTRLDKEWELEDISKKIKVPLKYLDAIENEIVANFPSEPYCSLIIKDYADYLGLNGTEILSLFRRDFDQKRKVKSSKKTFFSFTPQFTFTVSIIAILIIFSFYLISEYLKFHQPPKLKINWPHESTVSASIIEINGSTDIEATIRVNQDLILVDNNGNFQKKINLNSGDNRIVIESTSPNGKTTIEEKTINSSP
ncbi:MAG: helix-turn-helix domain-containing protein [Candidatus Shapirobacteria bacterium]|jgi:cytoskeletal protein RodZ